MERIDELFSDVCFPIDSRDLRNPNFHYQTSSQSRLIAVGPTHVVVETDKVAENREELEKAIQDLGLSNSQTLSELDRDLGGGKLAAMVLAIGKVLSLWDLKRSNTTLKITRYNSPKRKSRGQGRRDYSRYLG